MSSKPAAQQIFTVGHSHHEMPVFFQILAVHCIQVVVDVRSAPYSKYASQFNKREIEQAATAEGLHYLFMGDQLGGKPSGPELRDEAGRVCYEKIAASLPFRQGIDRLLKGMEDGWSIALMCAEEDPFNCHRHRLIARELERNRAIPVWHLRAHGARVRAGDYLQEQPVQLCLF